jgi:hypothetical protein
LCSAPDRAATEICAREQKELVRKRADGKELVPASASAAAASSSGGGEEEADGRVTIDHIEKAIQEVLSESHIAIMRRCSKHEK